MPSSLDVAEQLAAGQHVGLFYTTEEQHRSVVTAFLRRGLERGARTLYVSRAHEPDSILAYLREDGADADGALSRQQLQVVRWGQLSPGDPSAGEASIAAGIATLAEEAVAEGFSGLWLSVEWTGTTNGDPNADSLLRQEARIEECIRQTPTTVLCQFDCRQAAPHALIQALRLHPCVMVGLTAHENPSAIASERRLHGNGQEAEFERWIGALTGRGQATMLDSLRTVTAVADELVACPDVDTLFRRGVELAREKLGFERCSVYTRQGDLMRGTYGTTIEGKTADERDCTFVADRVPSIAEVLSRPAGAARWTTMVSPYQTLVDGRFITAGEGWVAVTPIVSANRVVGVFFNDAAISGAELSEAQQEIGAVYCSLLGSLLERRRAEDETAILGQLAARLAGCSSPPDLFAAVREESERLLGWDAYYLAVDPGEERTVFETAEFVDTIDGRQVVFPHQQNGGLIPSPQAQRALGGETVLLNRSVREAEAQQGSFGDSSRASLSLMYAPVRSGEQIVGVLSAQSYTPSRYGVTDVGTLQRLADIVSPALERVFAEEALRHGEERLLTTTRRLEALAQIGDELITCADMDTLLRRAVELPRERLGFERTAIFLRDGDWLMSTYGTDLDRQTTDERGDGFQFAGFKEWMGVLARPLQGARWEVEEGPLWSRVNGEGVMVGEGWFAFTPIACGGEIIGGLFNDTAISGIPVDEAQQQIGALYCSLLGGIIQRRRSEGTTGSLSRLASRLTACDTFDQLLLAVREEGERLRDWDAYDLVVGLGPDTGGSEPTAARGERVETINGEKVITPWDQDGGLTLDETAQGALTGETVLLNPSPTEADAAGEYRSLIHAPIHDADKVVGVISIRSRRSYKYGESDARTMQRLAAVVTRALERVVTAEALRRERDVAQRVLETSPSAIMVVKRDGAISLANDRAKDLLRLRWHAEGGHWVTPPWRLTTCDGGDVRPEDLPFFSVQESRAPVYGFRHAIHWPGEREPLYISANAAPLVDGAGEVEALVLTIDDISARIRLGKQLEQAGRLEAIGRLAGGVAHDFNNIITGITGYSELLLEGLNGDSPQAQDVKTILSLAQRAASLTRQLLAFSRQQSLQRSAVDINRLVTDLTKMLQRVIGESVQVRCLLADDAGYCQADAGQIEQVLMNLAVNARDAMLEGGSLTIESTRVVLGQKDSTQYGDVAPGEYVLLSVTDTGHGMDEETQARAFDPFFTTKTVGQGTGLGLAMVYGIIRQHGGHVSIHSEPGRGTSFRIYLPPAAEPPDVQPAVTAAWPSARGHEAILVVEDEESVRQVVERTLTREGYETLSAAHAAEAEATFAARGSEIVLVLTDVVMPGGTGHELFRRLSASRPDLRVLYMSGYAAGAVAGNGPLGDSPFIQKPFAPGALAERVRRVLDQGK